MSTQARPNMKSSEQEEDIDLRMLDDKVTNYIKSLLMEKDKSNQQNLQLWKIIQKQRLIIQQLQKTLAKKDTLSPILSEENLEASVHNLNTTSSLKDLNTLAKEKSKTPPLTRNAIASLVPENNKVGNRMRSQSVNKEPIQRDAFQKHVRSKTMLSMEQPIQDTLLLNNPLTPKERIFSRQIDPNSIATDSPLIITKKPLSSFKEQEEAIEFSPSQIPLALEEANHQLSDAHSKVSFEEQPIKSNLKDIQNNKRDTIKDTLLDFYLSPDSQATSPIKEYFNQGLTDPIESTKSTLINKKLSSNSIRSLPDKSENQNDKVLTRKSSLQTEVNKQLSYDKIIQKKISTNSLKMNQNDNNIFNKQLKSLDGIIAQVMSSSVTINNKGKEVLKFRIIINKIKDKEGSQEATNNNIKSSQLNYLWTIDKYFSDFLDLDTKLKTSPSYIKSKTIKLPEKKSLNTASPSKIDQRKLALQSYLQSAIDNNKLIPSFVSDFICTDKVKDINNNEKIKGKKEGYLIKRGKNFGKWKRRYFVLKSNILEYFESKNGTKLGLIMLEQAQVAVQHTSSSEYEPESTTSDAFRHAFMILEPKKTSTTVNRHVLCADSDFERDEWVEAITYYLKRENNPMDNNNNNNNSFSSLSEAMSPEEVNSFLDGANLSPIATSMAYIADSPTQFNNNNNNLINSPDQLAMKSNSTLSSINNTIIEKTKLNEIIIPTKSKNRTKSETKNKLAEKENKEKTFKQFFFNKKMFSLDNNTKLKPPQLPVFGVPLAQSVLASKVSDGYELPSVVYRCIQYLDFKQAHKEEGIYRLSGSSNTIRALKSKFDLEGDYPILDSGIYYDVHAVSGLLKLYLRELPSTVLTAELHKDFLQITDLLSRKERVHELGRLICSLPIENYTLLRALIGHLITVIQESEINKMNIRNIAIVFAPTLGIPAGVFSLLIAEFKYVFFVDSSGSAAPLDVSDDEIESNSTNSILDKESKKESIDEVNINNNNLSRFPQHSIYEQKALRRIRHRKTMSADVNNNNNLDLNQTSHLPSNPAHVNTNDLRPTSAYSDTTYLAPSISKPSLNIQTNLGIQVGTPIEKEANEDSDGSSTLPSKDVLSSPTIANLKKKRSNRNSLIYKSMAPPELVRLEERLIESHQVEDDLIDQEVLSNEI